MATKDDFTVRRVSVDGKELKDFSILQFGASAARLQERVAVRAEVVSPGTIAVVRLKGRYDNGFVDEVCDAHSAGAVAAIVVHYPDGDWKSYQEPPALHDRAKQRGLDIPCVLVSMHAGHGLLRNGSGAVCIRFGSQKEADLLEQRRANTQSMAAGPAAGTAAAGAEVPSKVGWMFKKGGSKEKSAYKMFVDGGRRRNWKQRYFVLQGINLHYYGSPDDRSNGTPPKGTVVVKACRIRPDLGRKEGESSQQHGFALLFATREFALATDTPEEKQSWMAHIQQALDKASGKVTKHGGSNSASGQRNGIKEARRMIQLPRLLSIDGVSIPFHVLKGSAVSAQLADSVAVRAAAAGPKTIAIIRRRGNYDEEYVKEIYAVVRAGAVAAVVVNFNNEMEVPRRSASRTFTIPGLDWSGSFNAALSIFIANLFSVVVLHGRAGHLPAILGGLRPWQWW